MIPAGPADREIVTFTMEGALARNFVALLNMNKIRDARGCLVVYGLENSGGAWILTETIYTDR